MTNPEQGQERDFREAILPTRIQEDAGIRFLNEALASRRFESAEKQTKVTDSKPNTNSKVSDSKPNINSKAGSSVENEGNIESLKLPGGFSKGHSDKKNNLVEFDSSSDKNTKVCYWKRSDFHADEEDSERIADVLKKPPHKLDEQETLDLLPLMKPGRPWGNGNYKDLSLSTDDIDGRRVLVANFKFDQGKSVHLIIANPNNENHQVDNLWLEGPSKDFDKNNQPALEAIKQLKWAKPSEK